jgi:large subunit ribosomal protein L18
MQLAEMRRTARHARKERVRDKVRGTDERPRLSVFRSNKYLYVQVISDESGRTLVADSTLADLGPGVTLDKAKTLGSRVAAKCKQAGIGQVVFDRNGYQYHGRIKAMADAAREAGLKF